MPPPERLPCVLVVDDNEQNRALARAALEMENYELLLASRGEEALALFESRRPDCVLLDVRMPGMDGPETCRRLRALPGGKDVPVVFLTASRDVDTFEAARRRALLGTAARDRWRTAARRASMQSSRPEQE